MRLSRRNLLRSLPVCAPVYLSFQAPVRGASQQPAEHFPTQARERLAVTSWPFRAYLISSTNRAQSNAVTGMDLKDFPAFIVKTFNVRNINPLADHFSSTEPAYLEGFRTALTEAGSHLVDLGLAGKNFYSSDAAARRDAFNYTRKWIDIASATGSPSVRQHLRAQRGQKPEVLPAADGLADVAQYAAKKNIVVNLENDDATSEDPFLLTAIIDRVNSPYVRALPDFGNTLISHDADYNTRGVKAMLERAYNMCHVKDSVETDGGQRLKVDLSAMFDLAKRSGYHGYYSMEFDTGAGDPIAGTRKLIEETLQYLT